MGAALEVEDIFDEEELKEKGIIQTKLVTRAEYEQRLKDENNDVRRIRGNQYLQYSIGEPYRERIQKFLNENPTLKEIKAEIDLVAKQEIPAGDVKPKNRKKNKPKNPQELLIDAFMANFSEKDEESIELFERIINHEKATKSEKIEAHFNIVKIYLQQNTKIMHIERQIHQQPNYFSHLLTTG